jgi:hypothetical protein
MIAPMRSVKIGSDVRATRWCLIRSVCLILTVPRLLLLKGTVTATLLPDGASTAM